MRRLLLLLLLLTVPVAADDALAAATAAAQSFLSQVDQGKYVEAYQATAPIVQKAATEEQFVLQVGSIRDKLGALKGRKLAKTIPPDQLPQEQGKFYVFEYQSNFANKAGVTELVSPQLQPDGSWKVAGYRFK